MTLVDQPELETLHYVYRGPRDQMEASVQAAQFASSLQLGGWHRNLAGRCRVQRGLQPYGTV